MAVTRQPLSSQGAVVKREQMVSHAQGGPVISQLFEAAAEDKRGFYRSQKCNN